MEQILTINKAIAGISRRIPYIPELKVYCKTTNACLLMTQLEYRFASMPNGFYKFLAPCEHSLYKKGDSWTEELAFSATEIRNAFENIGERYSSNKKITEIIEKGQDPFIGKYYLSYRDIRNGLTFYQRNHKLANQIAALVLAGFDPGFTQLPPDESEVSELDKHQFMNQPNIISGNRQSSFPIKGIQESTAKVKAASKLRAAETKIFTDVLISEKLTEQQINAVKILVSELVEAQKIDFSESPEFLCQAICFELLDQNSFKKCKQEFPRKLNAIKNEIVKSRWTIPANMLKQEKETSAQEHDSLKRKIQEAISDQKHWERMKSQHFQKGILTLVEQCEKEIIRAQTLVRQYQQELRQITSN